MIRHRHHAINSQDDGPLTASAGAPGEGVPLPPSSGAGEEKCAPSSIGLAVLPDPFGLYLSIIAAHDHCTREEFLTGAICRRLDEIGISRALDLAQGAEQTFLRGGEEASRLAHNQEIAGASPASATSDNQSAVTDGRDDRRDGCSGDAALPASRDPP